MWIRFTCFTRFSVESWIVCFRFKCYASFKRSDCWKRNRPTGRTSQKRTGQNDDDENESRNSSSAGMSVTSYLSVRMRHTRLNRNKPSQVQVAMTNLALRHRNAVGAVHLDSFLCAAIRGFTIFLLCFSIQSNGRSIKKNKRSKCTEFWFVLCWCCRRFDKNNNIPGISPGFVSWHTTKIQKRIGWKCRSSRRRRRHHCLRSRVFKSALVSSMVFIIIFWFGCKASSFVKSYP